MKTMKEVEKAEAILYDTLGAETMLLNIIKYLDYDTKSDMYDYIARQFDIKTNNEEDDNEEE